MMIGGNLFFLATFKYLFFKKILIAIFPFANFIATPLVFIGISFFTFRLLSLLLDIYYGTVKDKVEFIDYFNYLLFFPSFLSGPIDRFPRFVNDIKSELRPSHKELFEAVYRIILGAFKKKVIADTLFTFCAESFNQSALETLPIYKVILSQYIYVFVLYFDFSGYSDIAIGVSNLFGIKTPENFNKPFSSRNIQVFWNNWHISLMLWLRDYLYFPLQTRILRLGVKSFTGVACFSYLITFVLAGVWHGAGIHYLYYGIFHGAGFTIYLTYKRGLERYLSKKNIKRYKRNIFIRYFAIFLTFNFFTASLFFFTDKGEFFSVIFRELISG